MTYADVAETLLMEPSYLQILDPTPLLRHILE